MSQPERTRWRLRGTWAVLFAPNRPSCRMPWAVLLLLLVLPSPAHASFFNTFGADARGIALGGAMAAMAEGWSSVYYNPACLALSHDIEFSAGALWATPQLTVDYDTGPKEDEAQFPRSPQGMDSLAGPVLGLLVPLERCTPKKLPSPIALGIGIFVPRQALATTRVIEQTYPFDVIFNERNASLALHLAVSTRITPAVYIGAGLASQLVTSANAQLTDIFGNAVDLKARFGTPTVLAGLLIRPTERIRIGLVYRQENKVRSKWTFSTQNKFIIIDNPPPGLSEGDFVLYPPQSTLTKSYVSGFTPENFTLGGSYKFTERLRVGLDVSWYRWSQYRGPADTGLEFEFNDIWIPRIGVVYRITRELDARLGFYYEPTPVTNQSRGFFPVGNDRLVPSLGIGYTFHAPWGLLVKPVSLDACFQYHFLDEKEFNRANPINPYTRNPDLNSDGYVINLGLSLTFRF
jgi:long-subunit fatty acid transport protein